MSATATAPAAPARINLGNLDVTVVIDISGSMDGESDTPTKQTRWKYARESVLQVVKALGEYDDDGLDLIFFNAKYKVEEKVNVETFPAAWDSHPPGGSTIMAPPLKAALALAEKRWGEKNQLIVVITDGQPSDENDVAQVIISTANKMTRDAQCAILFAQVGKDPLATAFLKKLDDDLESQGAKFDIVDTDNLEVVAGRPIQELVDKTFND